jgi:hypothetical protein
MTPAQQDLKAYRGNDEPQIFEFFEESAGVENPLPISGAFTQARMQVRVRRSSDSAELFSKALGTGITASGNKLTVSFTAAELQAVAGGVYWYDLKVVRVGDNDQRTLFFGKFELTDNVTI